MKKYLFCAAGLALLAGCTANPARDALIQAHADERKALANARENESLAKLVRAKAIEAAMKDATDETKRVAMFLNTIENIAGGTQAAPQVSELKLPPTAMEIIAGGAMGVLNRALDIGLGVYQVRRTNDTAVMLGLATQETQRASYRADVDRISAVTGGLRGTSESAFTALSGGYASLGTIIKGVTTPNTFNVESGGVLVQDSTVTNSNLGAGKNNTACPSTGGQSGNAGNAGGGTGVVTATTTTGAANPSTTPAAAPGGASGQGGGSAANC